MKDLEGKVAFVTGAASGIGLAITTALAQSGVKVMMCDIEQAALDKALADLRKTNADVEGVVADVSLKEQMQAAEGRLPDTVIAAIGGGSNAMGLFFPFLDDTSVNIIGVEAGGKGVNMKMEHCASLTGGRPGVLHGNRTYLLQDDDGQILEGYSISAGLDYPGIGPEHAWLHEIGRAQYVSITDKEALEAFQLSCALEGIIPALEPSHALAHVMKIAGDLPKDHLLVMNMCGRGDKDIFSVAKHLGFDMSGPEGRVFE